MSEAAAQTWKLVRDCFDYLPHRVADRGERYGLLAAKLDEEVAEVKAAAIGSPEFVAELGDLVEVCFALGGEEAVEAARLAKKAERGGFDLLLVMRLADCTDRSARVSGVVQAAAIREWENRILIGLGDCCPVQDCSMRKSGREALAALVAVVAQREVSEPSSDEQAGSQFVASTGAESPRTTPDGSLTSVAVAAAPREENGLLVQPIAFEPVTDPQPGGPPSEGAFPPTTALCKEQGCQAPRSCDDHCEIASGEQEAPTCGVDSTLIEAFDPTAGGAQFYVQCSCGYETPERTSEAEAWRDHDQHAFPESSPVPQADNPGGVRGARSKDTACRDALRGLLAAAEAEAGAKVGSPEKTVEYWAAMESKTGYNVPGVERRITLARSILAARAALAESASVPQTALPSPESASACNICGEKWPKHHVNCAYRANVVALRAAEVRVRELTQERDEWRAAADRQAEQAHVWTNKWSVAEARVRELEAERDAAHSIIAAGDQALPAAIRVAEQYKDRAAELEAALNEADSVCDTLPGKLHHKNIEGALTEIEWLKLTIAPALAGGDADTAPVTSTMPDSLISGEPIMGDGDAWG